MPGQPESASPKLATPLARSTMAGFKEHHSLREDGFRALGGLKAFWLTEIWGAAVPRFRDEDLAAFPGGSTAMHDAYARAEARIGISSPTTVARPLSRLRLGRSKDGVSLAPARNAVIDAPKEGRGACNSCGLCLVGCARGSIWSARHAIADFRRFPGFDYRHGAVALSLAPLGGDNHRILLQDGTHLDARVVVLAAGTIGTTALALDRLGMHGIEVRLQNNPVAAMAFVAPRLVGAAMPRESFGLAQVRHAEEFSDGVVASGMLYGADTLPLGAVADRLPLSRPVALRLATALAPALSLATIYLPGSFSENRLCVTRAGRRIEVAVSGETTSAASAALRLAGRLLSSRLRREGLLAVPGSFAPGPTGSDAHYAATVPMGGTGIAACSGDGELLGALGIVVADGSCLPLLPSEHPTLTVVTNSERIGRAPAARMRG
jgi:ferredoxin